MQFRLAGTVAGVYPTDGEVLLDVAPHRASTRASVLEAKARWLHRIAVAGRACLGKV